MSAMTRSSSTITRIGSRLLRASAGCSRWPGEESAERIDSVREPLARIVGVVQPHELHRERIEDDQEFRDVASKSQWYPRQDHNLQRGDIQGKPIDRRGRRKDDQ